MHFISLKSLIANCLEVSVDEMFTISFIIVCVIFLKVVYSYRKINIVDH